MNDYPQWSNYLRRLVEAKYTRSSSLWIQTTQDIISATDSLGIIREYEITFNSFGYRQPKVTWMSFLLKGFTGSVQQGVYPLMIIDELGEKGCLCVAVAWNQFARRMPLSRAESTIKVIKNELSPLFPHLQNRAIDLRATTPLGRGLEQCVLVDCEFEMGSIQDNQFHHHLEDLLREFLDRSGEVYAVFTKAID